MMPEDILLSNTDFYQFWEENPTPISHRLKEWINIFGGELFHILFGNTRSLAEAASQFIDKTKVKISFTATDK